jgi:tRNA A37 threonylcarbamoyladenosine modification protein TsaB
MDAGRGQVFSAVYRNGALFEAALVDKPDEILARWAREGTIPQTFAGDGALAYRDLILSTAPGIRVVDPVPPLTPAVARLADIHVQQHGALSPDAIRPIYIRRSDVELARDRKAAS